MPKHKICQKDIRMAFGWLSNTCWNNPLICTTHSVHVNRTCMNGGVNSFNTFLARLKIPTAVERKKTGNDPVWVRDNGIGVELFCIQRKRYKQHFFSNFPFHYPKIPHVQIKCKDTRKIGG